MKKLLLLLLFILLVTPQVTNAQFTVPQGGTGRTSFPLGGWLFSDTSLRLNASSSPTVGYITATSTATSTFGGGINIAGGCFAIGGTCFSGGGGSGTVNSGTAGQVPFYQSNGTTLTATSTLFISTGGFVGINNTSPATELDITGTGGATVLRISAPTFQTTGINFMPTGGATAKAWSIQTDHGGDFDIINNSTGLFTITGNVDGGGTGYVGLASTTPGSNLAIGTSTSNFINLSVNSTSTLARGLNIRNGCFSINNVCILDGFFNIAGRSLTGSGNTINADAELYTHSSTYNYASSSLTAMTSRPVLAKKFPQDATISTISCQNIGSGTSTIMFEERTSLNTAGTDVLYSDGLSAGGDLELASSTISNNSIASGAWLVMLIDAVTGTPNNPVCDVKYTYND